MNMPSVPVQYTLLTLDNLRHTLYVLGSVQGAVWAAASRIREDSIGCPDASCVAPRPTARQHAVGLFTSKQHLCSAVAAAWNLRPSWSFSCRYASTATSNNTAREVPSVEQLEKECWNCQHHMKRGSFACKGCERIQPVDPSLNYFELFGMPNMEFDMDLAKLERQYKLLQWNLHPDKVVRRTPQEQAFAAQQATLINHAYSILRSPLSRANYILSLKGIAAGDEFEGTIQDKEFLMEVMEARETVDETDDADELKQMLSENRGQQQSVIQQLSEALRTQRYSNAVQLATQLTYLARLEHEIVGKLPAQ